MSDYKITILHLYPDLLNLYGDKGNIECMKKRLEWRGIEAEVINCTMDCESMDFSQADIVFLGGGSDREQELVSDRLLSKKQELTDFVENGGVVLAVCGGYQLLGKYYQINERRIDGLGILDIHTDKPKDAPRLIGNVIIECDGFNSKVVGFENHGGRTSIGSHTPFGRVVKGFGNDGATGYEGVRYKNVIGTYLHGPLLPKNPELCDYILENALKNKYSDFKGLSPLDDGLENLAGEYMLNRI